MKTDFSSPLKLLTLFWALLFPQHVCAFHALPPPSLTSQRLHALVQTPLAPYNLNTRQAVTLKNRQERHSITLFQKKNAELDDIKDDEQSFLSLFAIVLPLLFIYIANQWSRSSIYYLVNFSSTDTTSVSTAMNLDLQFDESQYGALASIAFTALFAITSLFAGALADRYDRKLLTLGSTAVFTGAILFTSFAHSYNEVLIARVVMGLACAFTTPSAYTLIRDFIKEQKASLANSIYGSGVYFGGGLSSLSILLDNLDGVGWRGTCQVISVFGVVSIATAALLLPKDPKSKTSDLKDNNEEKLDSPTPSSPLGDAQQVLATKRVQWLFLASFFRFSSGLLIGVWAAPYFQQAFPNDVSSYAVINALIVGFCGVSSGLFGGWAADQVATASSSFNSDSKEDTTVNAALANVDANAARLSIPVVGSLLAIPAWWYTVHAPSFEYAMIFLAIEYIVAECWFGPTVAVLQSEVGAGRGGTAQGMFTLTGAIGNLAPSVLGFLYVQQQQTQVLEADGNPGNIILANLLGGAVCAGYLLSALCFAKSATEQSSQRI